MLIGSQETGATSLITGVNSALLQNYTRFTPAGDYYCTHCAAQDSPHCVLFISNVKFISVTSKSRICFPILVQGQDCISLNLNMNGYCTCQIELAKLSCTSTLFFVSSYSVISYHNCYKIPYFLIHRIIWMTLFSPPHILVTFFVTQASKFFKFFILIALNDFIFTFADRMASALHNILSVSYIWEGYRVWLTYLLVYLIYS